MVAHGQEQVGLLGNWDISGQPLHQTEHFIKMSFFFSLGESPSSSCKVQIKPSRSSRDFFGGRHYFLSIETV